MNVRTCLNQSDVYLSNKISLEGHICGGDVRNRHGKDIRQSLCLMDDSVSVGQVLPVLY